MTISEATRHYQGAESPVIKYGLCKFDFRFYHDVFNTSSTKDYLSCFQSFGLTNNTKCFQICLYMCVDIHLYIENYIYTF